MKKALVNFISKILPNLVVSFAYNQLTNPQVKKLRANELVTLDTSEKEILKFAGFDIQLYTWKGGEDAVLLIHGWEGQAGNFSDVIEALLKKNFTVYAFDGPSHGFSSKGETSLFEFTELVGIIIRKFKVKKLISHSFGGVATTYALQQNKDLAINKYLLLTVPNRFLERINDVSEFIGITENVKNKLIARLEKETNQDISLLNVSDFVQNLDVKKALIIHDKNDTVIPIIRAKKVHENWKNSDLMEIEGTGHFRILRTEHVIEKSINFLID
jgi:pimeloyl-ACP methyl ester carboxylesterase